PVLLAALENRLEIRAHIAELPEPLAPDKLTDPVLNAMGRAEALHAFAAAFGRAVERLKLERLRSAAEGRPPAENRRRKTKLISVLRPLSQGVAPGERCELPTNDLDNRCTNTHL